MNSELPNVRKDPLDVLSAGSNGPQDNGLREPVLQTSSHQDIPVLTQFEQVAEQSLYVPLPGDWQIGIADIVNSTAAIKAGRYKSVNFAGAAIISAVSNAVGGKLPLFAFGGDGAHFAVQPDQAASASTALSQLAGWVKADLKLDIRVGMISVDDIRKSGLDIRTAYWQASTNAKYALFSGGGLEWAEKQLKAGHIFIRDDEPAGNPDLTGLSCQWGPVRSSRGRIISLIVKPGHNVTPSRFETAAREIIGALFRSGAVNPVPAVGPDVRFPVSSIDLQSRAAQSDGPRIWRKTATLAIAAFHWALFKIALPLRGFLPDRYRAEIAANADFQKFNDGLMMTLDCSEESIDDLKNILAAAKSEGVIRYGLEIQDEALITCVVPSVFNQAHMHFIDGSGGGYASAAQQLRSDHETMM